MMQLTAVLSLLVAVSVGTARADFTSGGYTLPDPPPPGSQAYLRDFQVLHWWQLNRDERACALGRSQSSHTVESFFAKAGLLTADEYRRAEARLESVFKYTERVADKFKDKYRRMRPYAADSTLVPCVKKLSGQRAYPSAHAAIATAGACVLARLYPAKAKRILDYGAYLGQLRVIVGVHHPSDVAAGQSLGRQICAGL